MKRIAISLKKEYWQEFLRGDKQIEYSKALTAYNGRK